MTVPSEESADWDRILEERLAREASRRPTAPLPEGAKHASPPEEAAGERQPPTETARAPTAYPAGSSRAQFDGTAPFQDVPMLRDLSPEEEEEASEYLRSIPKARKLVLGVVLVVTAAVFGGGAYVAGNLRPPPPVEPLQAFGFETRPSDVDGFSAPLRPKPTKRPAEFDPKLDPLPGF